MVKIEILRLLMVAVLRMLFMFLLMKYTSVDLQFKIADVARILTMQESEFFQSPIP